MNEQGMQYWRSVSSVSITIVCVIVSLIAATEVAADHVTLVENGKVHCCVVVGSDANFKELAKANWNPEGTLLKWASDDIAHYLGEISGAEIPVGTTPVNGLVPIFVGSSPEPAKLGGATEFGDSYVVDVTNARIVLHGESRRAVYYAAAHVLHELGVRWYGPGKTGEVVPSRRTVRLEVGRRKESPKFSTRNIWCRGPEQTRWMYRNRLGEPVIPCGHSAHAYARTLPGWAKRRHEHPEFYALVDGKPQRMHLSHPEVVRHFATNAARTLKAGPRRKPAGKVAIGSISVSPDGGLLLDDRPETRALNGGRVDPVLRRASFSAAWFGFLNQVCAEIERHEPDPEFTLGSIASLNYVQPPAGLKLDPRIIPVVAPRTFNRYTSIGTAGAPTSEMLENVLRGWTERSPRVGMYLTNFIPGDMAMPYSRCRHWAHDIPKLDSLGIHDVTIESHPNWHTMMPGNYVAARLLWNPKTDARKLLDEYYATYYGPAAEAMRSYDTTLEDAYENTRAFASGIWDMHRILTPKVMETLERHLVEAEKHAKGQRVVQERVEIIRFSLTFAKHWFAARNALNRFDLAASEKHGGAFVSNCRSATTKHPLFFSPNVPFSPSAERYFELFHQRTCKDAGRIAREGHVVYRFPDKWSANLVAVDGDAQPSFDVSSVEETRWRTLRTFSRTLAEQDLEFFRGVVWYRHKFSIPADADAAGPLKLWLGGIDSRTRVILNDQQFPAKGTAWTQTGRRGNLGEPTENKDESHFLSSGPLPWEDADVYEGRIGATL